LKSVKYQATEAHAISKQRIRVHRLGTSGLYIRQKQKHKSKIRTKLFC